MKTLSAFLLLCLLPSLADAFCPPRRGRGNFSPYCPGPSCPDNSCPDNNCPVSPSKPTTPFVPIPAPELANGLVTQDDIDLVNSIIPVENRVRNPNVQCAWVAGSEVFVSAGYLQFTGWGEAAAKTHRWHGADMSNILAACDSVGVPYKSTRNGDLSIFEHARKEGVGVYVQIPGHALVCALLTDQWAYMVNNYDDPKASQRVEKWSRARFRREWTGVGCCPLHKKKPKEPVTPAVTPTTPKPVEPTPVPVKPTPVTPAAPAVDLKPITDSLVKLTEIATLTQQNLTVLGVKVEGIDKRLSLVEQRPATVAPVAPPVVAPPPDPRIPQLQADLDKLRQSLKQSGTLHITVTPK